MVNAIATAAAAAGRGDINDIDFPFDVALTQTNRPNDSKSCRTTLLCCCLRPHTHRQTNSYTELGYWLQCCWCEKLNTRPLHSQDITLYYRRSSETISLFRAVVEILNLTILEVTILNFLGSHDVRCWSKQNVRHGH